MCMGRREGLGWWCFVVVVVAEVLCMQVDLVCGSQADLVKRLERYMVLCNAVHTCIAECARNRRDMPLGNMRPPPPFFL